MSCTRCTAAQWQKDRCAKAAQFTHLFVRLQSAQQALLPLLRSQYALIRTLNLCNAQ
jgi:hypothetical protein